MGRFNYVERWALRALQVVILSPYNILMIVKAGITFTKVDLFASDTVKEGERTESLWAGGNVYACILRSL